jgi:hypothetical protein
MHVDDLQKNCRRKNLFVTFWCCMVDGAICEQNLPNNTKMSQKDFSDDNSSASHQHAFVFYHQTQDDDTFDSRHSISSSFDRSFPSEETFPDVPSTSTISSEVFESHRNMISLSTLFQKSTNSTPTKLATNLKNPNNDLYPKLALYPPYFKFQHKSTVTTLSAIERGQLHSDQYNYAIAYGTCPVHEQTYLFTKYLQLKKYSSQITYYPKHNNTLVTRLKNNIMYNNAAYFRHEYVLTSYRLTITAEKLQVKQVTVIEVMVNGVVRYPSIERDLLHDGLTVDYYY